MNEVINNMFERRTIRKYTDETVTDETLEQLYKVMESTQSWANTQCWEVVNVVDPEIREQLQATLPKQNPAYRATVDAPVLFALCAKKGTSGMIGDSMPTIHADWYMYDLGLMTQNLCLAAHSLGLGTVVVGWFDHNKCNEILNVPEGTEIVSIIPMGYRNQKGAMPKHKPFASFVHTDKF
ncbi:nitroreductase family protein [Maridesulfovibrio frigidus]|uniref:nitroreductase family protein n=1 Tax=Maridesulfovibrio frigidus TaxID=340956 RepID=UPI0004E0C1EB|nr:nitroreductase family protein [Maridesulfovibrio frigidus]